MANYFFYPAADEEQDTIYAYTLDQWGEKQAEKYINGLHQHLQKLADKEAYWHPLPIDLVRPIGVDVQAFFSRYEKHTIFFRAFSDASIGVMSILHQAMDIPVRLKLDLDILNSQSDD